MWMVGGYNESSHHHHHHQVNLGPHDAFNAVGRKLRPLIPRPPVVVSSSSSTTCTASSNSCNFALYSASDLFSLHHPFQGVNGVEQGIISHKNKIDQLSNISNNNNGAVVMSTSRWNPTPEQLRTLEDLYRRGTRTPSTEQIQRITGELRRYGKIEGKNVFYWFQNHKARERQKRRRELEFLSHDQRHHDPVLQRKDRGPAIGKQGFEGEQIRSHYNIASTTPQEAGVESMQRSAAAKAIAVSDHPSRHNSGRLFQIDGETNATWQNLVPSSSASFRYPTTSLGRPCIDVTCDITRIGSKTRRFIPSLEEPIAETTKDYEVGEDEGSATLQLFPLTSQEEEEDKSKERDVHFFEFLPPKIN